VRTSGRCARTGKETERVIERFTRDQASKFVWAATALAAALGLAYAIVGGGRAVEVERTSSHARAVRYVQEVLDPRLDTRDLASPLTGTSSESLGSAVRRSILADERVSRVRIWSTDGTLLFSTDPSDHRGSDEGLNDPVLLDASREGALTRTDLSDGGGADDPERTLLRTYVPLGTASVAEIDQTDAGTVGPPRTAWFYYQLLAGGVLLSLLVMTAISLRDPIEPINTGVPFAASSVPRGFSLIDDDRLAAVQEVYRLASERVARLEEKLAESEEARRRLESLIQQGLSKIGRSAPSPAVPAADASPPQAPPAPEPTVVQVPESDVLPTAAFDDALASAPAGPLARASRAQKLPPTASLQQKPVGEKPKRVPKRPKAKPKQQNSAPTEVSKTRPEPGPESEAPRGVASLFGGRVATKKSGHSGTHEWQPVCDVLGCEHAEGPEVGGEVATSRAGFKRRRRQAVTAPAKAPAAAPPIPTKRRPRSKAPGSAPKGEAAPAPQPAAPPRSETDDAKAHAAALETFIRLTESDRQHQDAEPADQGEMRAALARTAARKKPGGDRLQPHERSHEESLGGPPKGKA
jgi:hypothetical protein